MRELHADRHEADTDGLYRLAAPPGRPADHPWVVVNMIATLDGAVVVDGRSGALGGPTDRAVFQALRAQADVVLVGAGTVRAERYRTPSAPDLEVAVVSGRLDLDWSWPLFSEGRAIVVTTTSAGPVPAEVPTIRAGEDRVDLLGALGQLGRRGARVVLCEGGPTLNGSLIAAGLADELCLTVAPMVVAGDSTRLARAAQERLTRMRLQHAATGDDGYLFLRYVRVEGS